MSSILTNTSAMVALQTLKSVNSSLQETQSQISTGKSVASAKDNSAVWAISKAMDSDVKGFMAISESLALGESTVAVARNASETVTELLTEIKGRIVAAQESNVDRSKIQTDIDELTDQIKTVVDAAQFNGLNLVKGTDGVDILSSLDRSDANTITASNITVDRQDLTTTAGAIGTVAAANAANAAIQDSATAVADTGNTALLAVTNLEAGDELSLTVDGFAVSAVFNTDIDTTGANLAGAINALGLDGISASFDATDDDLIITSTKAFDEVALANVAVSDAGGSATPTFQITDVNGAAITPATSADITQRAEEILFSANALVNEGDGYGVTLGGSTYNYVAGRGETFEDVARGLKTAIDNASIDGVSTRVVGNDDGSFSLLIDNDSSTSLGSFATVATENGDASGGLFGLDNIDVRTSAGADSALGNIETLIQNSIDAAANFGSAEGRIEIQSEFVGKLMDSLRAGIGSLVDANMEEASARLQALQVQQQLATQSLSIANQAPQNILALFR
jgi:flagellin